MIVAVLDTNVVLDLLHWRDAGMAGVAAAIGDGRLRCASDTRCLHELRTVLAYPKFGIAPAQAQAIYARYQAMVECVDTRTPPPLPRCRDREDQKFIEVAACAGAGLLVSKDKAVLKLGRSRLLPAGLRILAPLAASRWLLDTPAGDV